MADIKEITIKKGSPDQDFKIVSPERLEELLRVSEEPEPITLVLDKDTNEGVVLYVKEATVIETQKIMESFIGFSGKQKRHQRQKESDISFKLREYYREAWRRWVKRTEPKMTYKQVKYYHHDFNNVLKEIFPDPFSLFSEGAIGIDAEEEKN